MNPVADRAAIRHGGGVDQRHDPAAFYTGIVAEAYSMLRSTRFEPARYAAFVREHGEPALEIGCGEGDPLLDLRAAGLDVAGLDSSADMLRRCRAMAERRGLAVDLYEQPMQEMDLGRTFASIYLAGPTFNLLPDESAGRCTLRALADHLTPDGAALVPLWVPPPTPADQFGRTRETVDDEGVHYRCTPVSERYDERARDRVTTLRYEREDASGTTTVLQRDWLIHWWTPESFEELCAGAGVQLDTLSVSEGGADLTAVVRRG